jgi:RNA polymerase sigma factor (sigma-70 family)
MDSPVATDEQLWQLSRNGDTEAFRQIVERYQPLICALAVSACGSLAASEDLAQETFISAWRQLADLREPRKLRQWLCGIMRNLAANTQRRVLRRGGAPVSLDSVEEGTSSVEDPASQTVSREEEALLWRTLSGLPENYREPLVLFYREQKSVAEVAIGLDLSEDVVKQRLSRGRAMLREEMAALVESTLTRTKPTTTFTAGVLAALPLISERGTSAAVATGIAKGAAAAGKSALSNAALGTVAGPVTGLLVGLIGSKAAVLAARSPQERSCIKRYVRRIVIFCWVMSIGLAATLSQAGKLYPVSLIGILLGVGAWTAALVLTIHFWGKRMQREVDRIRIETGTEDRAEVKP